MSRPKLKRSLAASPPPAQPRTLRTTLDEIPRLHLPKVTPAGRPPAPLKGVPAPRTTSDGVLPLPSLKPATETGGAHPPLPRPPRRR